MGLCVWKLRPTYHTEAYLTSDAALLIDDLVPSSLASEGLSRSSGSMNRRGPHLVKNECGPTPWVLVGSQCLQ